MYQLASGSEHRNLIFETPPTYSLGSTRAFYPEPYTLKYPENGGIPPRYQVFAATRHVPGGGPGCSDNKIGQGLGFRI